MMMILCVCRTMIHRKPVTAG